MEPKTPIEGVRNRPQTTLARRGVLALAALAVTGALLIAPTTAIAEESQNTSARKIGRGVANMTLGVLAIPGEITRTTREKGPFLGATWGLVKGVGMTVATEVVGVFEILTCPFETPPGFKPILEPEFPWDYFTGPRPSPTTRTARTTRTTR